MDIVFVGFWCFGWVCAIGFLDCWLWAGVWVVCLCFGWVWYLVLGWFTCCCGFADGPGV